MKKQLVKSVPGLTVFYQGGVPAVVYIPLQKRIGIVGTSKFSGV